MQNTISYMTKENTLGENIRFYRHKANMTQNQLAEKLELTWEMVSRYERGSSSPVNRIDAIAEALGVDVGNLLQKDYKPNSSPAPRIRYFERIPGGVTVENLKDLKSYVLYTAPDWIYDEDKDTFMVDTAHINIQSARIKKSGAVYVSPNSKLSDGDLALLREGTSYTIAQYDNSQPEENILGRVIAQELRY